MSWRFGGGFPNSRIISDIPAAEEDCVEKRVTGKGARLAIVHALDYHWAPVNSIEHSDQ
jgi:hypothetical protein